MSPLLTKNRHKTASLFVGSVTVTAGGFPLASAFSLIYNGACMGCETLIHQLISTQHLIGMKLEKTTWIIQPCPLQSKYVQKCPVGIHGSYPLHGPKGFMST